jgi:hypothetical protein
VEAHILKQMIDVIRVEEQRRAERRADMHAEVTYDQRVFTDALFVNELCLMLLVALSHKVEREVVLLRPLRASLDHHCGAVAGDFAPPSKAFSKANFSSAPGRTKPSFAASSNNLTDPSYSA